MWVFAPMCEAQFQKKRAGVIAQAGDRLGDLVAILPALAGTRRRKPLDVAREVLEPIIADRKPEILGRDILQLMGLVHNRMGARRNDLAIRVLPDGGVRTQQVMIDDHDVGCRRALAHPGDKAVVVPRAFGAEAGFSCGGHFAPERQIFGQVLELGAIAGLRTAGPLPDDREEHPVVRGAGRLVQPIQAMQAQVVRAPLHAGRGERHAEGIAQRRNVLEENLFLQVLGARGDEDPLPAQYRGNEVRDRLSRAGARFGQKNASGFEDLGDGG